jgi:hypothetical protein
LRPDANRMADSEESCPLHLIQRNRRIGDHSR